MIKNLEPLHLKLKQEHLEFNDAFRKERKEHPNTSHAEFSEFFFHKKHEKDVQDYKEKLNGGQNVRKTDTNN